LLASLLINLSFLALGAVLWSLMKPCRLGRNPGGSARFDDSADVRRPWLQSTAVRNYICFLQHCRDMFMVLTVISAVLTVPRWGVSPMILGVSGGAVCTTRSLDAWGHLVLGCDTLLRGLFALAFVERLQRRIKRPLLRRQEADSIQRTLWLSDLPVWDHENKQRFRFDDEDFARVAGDLQEAINQDLQKTTLGLFTPAGMRVQVAPVVDQWYKLSLRLRNAQEHLEVLRSTMNVHRKGTWGSLVTRWYARQHRLRIAEVAWLQVDLDAIVSGRKHMSGSAFITFQNPQHRDHFLRKRPRCWQFRDHAYFSFGVPPFASATLACTRAPHPSDVNWMNLHITRMEQRIRFIGLTLLLFISMVALVTPVTISSQLKVIIPTLQRHLSSAARWLDQSDAGAALSSSTAEFAYNQLPAVLLVVINSILLPQCIYSIALSAKPHRRSSVEVIQLHLNFMFLVLNAMVIPFLGLKGIDGLVAIAKEGKGHFRYARVIPTVAEILSNRLMHSPGIFALRYILNCACMTNINSLLQIPQLLYRAYARRVAITARESVEAEEVWVFAWGYWYAWTISIFTLGICMSSAVPSALPCAALFFTVQHAVDRYNLLHRVYSHGPDIESENLLAIRVLHYMRCVIAFWWFLMGSSLLVSAGQLPDELWDSAVPLWSVQAASGVLVSLSSALVAFSWWTHISVLHDNQFQTVDMAERGLSSTGALQGLFSNIDGILKNACCSPPSVGYGVLGSVETRLDRLDSTATDGSLAAEVPGMPTLDDWPEAGGERRSTNVGSRLSWDAKSVVLQPVATCGPL